MGGHTSFLYLVAKKTLTKSKPAVEKLLDKYERIKKKNEEFNEQLSELNEQLSEYDKYNLIIKNVSDVIESKNLVERIENEKDKIYETLDLIEVIKSSIEDYENQVPAISYDFENEKKLIKKIENIKVDKTEINSLENSINDYQSMKVEIISCDDCIQNNKCRLPDTCPLCGNPMKNGICKREVEE